MNRPDRLFDDRIAEWLEDGPDRAPSEILAIVAAALPSVSQRRRVGIVWHGFARLAAALAAGLMVTLVVVATIVRLGPALVAPQPTPTPEPTPTPRASVGVLDLAPFRSPFYGYTIDVPVGWRVSPATEALTGAGIPYVDTPIVDTITAPVSGPLPNAVLIGALASVPPGETLEAWTHAVADGQCGSAASREAIVLGDAPGILSTFSRCAGYFHLWATAIRDGVGAHVLWLDFNGAEESDRAAFERILATFQFPANLPSAGPTSTSSPSPSPSP